jgi:hypothetical protein
MADGARVRIDWDKNGYFTGGLDDVTNDVRDGFTCSFGRDPTSGPAPIVSGRGAVNLENGKVAAGGRKYSPRNTAGPLYTKLKPARPCLIERTVGGVTYTIFSAHTDSQPLSPDIANHRVTLNLVDWLADFRAGAKVTTQLYAGKRTGEVIGLILDAVGWTGGRDLDAGATVIPWWWENGADALDALQKVVASEGYPALLTVGPAGEIVFRDRHHRITRAESTTSQQTWRGTEESAEPILATGFSVDEGWQNVVNDITLQVDERQAQPYAAVWSTDETLTLGSNASRTVVISTSDPFKGALTPTAGRDFTLTLGSISSVTLSRTSGASTSVTITAGIFGATIQGLQLLAQSVPVVRSVTVTASDTTSIADYGSRGMPAGMDPVWCGRYDAQAIADLYVLQRKQPLQTVRARFMVGTGDAARATALLPRDLSDRVTIVEPESSTNGAFFVDRIEHTYRGPEEHEILFLCEAAPAAPVSPFILNTSTLNGSAGLGY